MQKLSSYVMILAAVLTLFGGGVVGQEVVVLDEIVAKVNQETITLTDLQRELDVLRLTLRAEIRDADVFSREFENQKRRILKEMIQNKMVLQRAEEIGIGTDVDVDVVAALERMRKQAGVPNLKVMDQALRQQGSSLKEYRRNLKRRIVVDALLQQSVYSRVTILTPEVEAFYQENAERYTMPAEVELKEILFLKEGRNMASQQRIAEEVLEKLHSDESFEDLAKKYSEGPTGSRGGDIGVFKESSMAAPVGAIVLQLQEGEISDVIETEYGFQIIKLVSKKAAMKKPLEEVRPEIFEELYQSKAQPGVRKFLETLREQSYIYVAPKYQQQFDVEGLGTL